MAAMEGIAAIVASSAPVWISTFFLLLLAHFYQKNRASVSKLPLVGAEFGTAETRKQQFWKDAKSLLRDGYQKYSAFRIQATSGLTVMLSRDYMVELIKRPDETKEEFEEPVKFDMMSKYTGLTTYNPIINHLIRSELTPGIPRFTPRVQTELEKILRQELPGGDDWQSIRIIDKMLRIVSIGAGTIIVGTDLCYTKEWIKCSIGYTTDVMGGAKALKNWPAFLRPLVHHFLPEMKTIREHEREIKALIVPVIQERRAKEGTKGYQKPDDMLQWMMDNKEKFNVTDEHIAWSMLGVGLVSIHSTTMTSVNGLFDLAARPEYAKPLRDELKQALKESNGQLTKDALYNCKLLDSFLKESQRYHPIILTFGKRVLKTGFTLSDGTYLPPGTIAAVPSEAVNFDSAAYDKPEEFDGYRFFKLREGKKGLAAEKNQWISTNKTNLNFGYGRHSCPGRFFAVMEIKLMFAFILLNYDVAVTDKSGGRYKNITFGDAQAPDPSRELLFRKTTDPAV